jgi:sterol desaturase/sphingolipid hydroxylase (fatty acid hydroxylase superfamily)
MSFTKKLNINWRVIENVIFVFAFGFIMYSLVSRYWLDIYNSIKGKGFIGAVIDPISTHNYYKSVVAIIIILNATCLLWEILSLIILLLKQERGNTHGYNKYKLIFKKVLVNYKPSFLALLILELLPKVLLLHMFWIWLPHLQKFSLFTINLKWYSWIYAYLCWEFATWVFHFSCHRVRFLWCLHVQHHAPTELNLTVNWVHFFAEGYYSTLVHLVILTPLGINPVMFLTIMSISSAWGIFTHISERALKNGRLGILEHLIITPAHHRVHHAKHPLYLDRNFATAVPLWDWVFGTLQPIKEDVRVDYGLTRDLDVTNFSDLYFGEILLLYRDVKNAAGLKNKLLYMVMPPGWAPACSAQTASALRRDFLKTYPALGITSKNRFLLAIKSGFKMDKPAPVQASFVVTGEETALLNDPI